MVNRFLAASLIGGLAASCAAQDDEGVPLEEVSMALIHPVAEIALTDSALTLQDCIIPRNDFYDETWVLFTDWGDFATCASFCPAGSFVYGVSVVSEAWQH